MPYLMIDGMDQYETERFFRYIHLSRVPKYVRNSDLRDMAYWFLKKCFPDNYRVKKLYQWHITSEPEAYIKRNGGYLV